MLKQQLPLKSSDNLEACLIRMGRGVAFRNALMGESLETSVPYAGPLLDAVALFERLGIGYALVGGVAAMYYGRARFTEDLDFVAATGHMDLLAANPAAMREHHFDPGCTWKLYHETGVDVDIWKDEHADAIIARAREVKLAGRLVKIAEPHDLIAMKLRAGRLQDDYDISEIIRGTAIDESIIQSITVPKEFAHYLQVKARVQP
jgi:hypothetical protein